MRTTMKDIAKECDVSVATVSLALAGKESRVSREKRELILEAAERLDYVPNRTAICLATNRSRLIGAIFPDLRNPHIASIFMETEEYLQGYNYSLLCHVVSENNIDQIHEVIREMVSAGVEGIVYFFPALSEQSETVLEETLLKSNVPVASFVRPKSACPGLDVNFNYEQGGYLATKHLIENGHQIIGCVAGPMKYNVTLERLKGYRRALEESGLTYCPRFVYESDYTMGGGKEALSYLLGQGVTAIFAFNDEMAFGLYQSARLYSVKIPQDVSIIGFDNVPFSEALEVPLSSINVPVREMSQIVAKGLIECIEKNGSKGRERVSFEPVLIVRGSVRKVIS